jgi:hypothetical protein
MPTPVDNIAAVAPLEKATADRPLATQQAALQRWLESTGKAPSAPGKPAKHPSQPLTKSVRRLPPDEKVATLRDALAANGLAIVPSIHQLPAMHKVVRVEDLLHHEL